MEVGRKAAGFDRKSEVAVVVQEGERIGEVLAG